MSNSSKGIIVATGFMITFPLDHQREHTISIMRYQGASIENIYCPQPPSILTQSIRIYDHIKVSPIGQSLLLILAQPQYPFKVESPCSIVAW